MPHPLPRPLFVTLATTLSLAFATFAGCGGGGGAASADPPPPPPPPPPSITAATGGTATSADGKLTLTVDANSASADAGPTFAQVAPPAEAAADPTLVADSSYRYSGPDLSFASPADWTLASPAAAGAGGGRSALAVPQRTRILGTFTPTPYCDRLWAQQNGLQAHSIYAHDSCPANCEQVWTNANDTLRICAPRDPLFVTVPIAQNCPAGTTDVSDTPGLPLTSVWRYCEFGGGNAQPTIAITPSSPAGGCTISLGKFICKVTKVANQAILSVFKDTEPPSAAAVLLFAAGDPDVAQDPIYQGTSGGSVKVPDGGSHAFNLDLVVQGSNEPVGLRQAELREITSIGVVNGAVDLSSTVRWSAVPANQSLPAGTKVVGPLLVPLTYSADDPPARYFFVRGIDWVGNVRVSRIIRVARASPTGPVVSGFTATPSVLGPTGGSTTLAWNLIDATSASIDNGVGAVASGSGAVTLSVTQTTTYTLTATNAVGSATSAVTVTVAPDTTAPAVTLAASSQNVVVPGGTTLSASASDNLGVTKVEFYEGATLLGTTNAAPHTLDIAYTSGNAGPHSYTARAYDAANNIGTSAELVVSVTLPSSADRFVNIATGNDANDGTSPASAYKTVGKGLSTVGALGTVWLANGTYTAASEGLNSNSPGHRSVPVGVTVRAASNGGAVLNFGLAFAGDGGAVDLVFVGPAVGGDMTGIDASAGVVTLSRLQFRNLGNAIAGGGGVGGKAALKIHGTAVVTLDNGAGSPLMFGTGIWNGVLAFDTAELVVKGGRAEPGNLAGCNSSRCTAQVVATGQSEVTFDGVDITLTSDGAAAAQPFVLAKGLSKVTIRNAGISQIAASVQYRDLAIVNEQATFTLAGSAVSTTFHNVVGLQDGTPTIVFDDVTLLGNVTNKVIGTTFFPVAPAPNVQIVNSHINNVSATGGVLSLGNGGTVRITGSNMTGNKNVVTLAGTAAYDLKVRNTLFAANATCAQPTCFTFSLAGGATSVFDFGTAVDPGLNTFSAANTGTGLLVKVNAAVTVDAVANTWAVSAQGADSLGRYVLGSAPCGTSTCSVTTGAGRNYVVQSGALKLAGP